MMLRIIPKLGHRDGIQNLVGQSIELIWSVGAENVIVKLEVTCKIRLQCFE